MKRSTDPNDLRDLMPEGSLGFDPETILSNGFCLIEGDDKALFEKKGGVCFGHYFLKSRGREAVDVSTAFLKEAFKECSVIAGLTPIENKAALWMTRRLGFTMTDVLDSDVGKMQLSMLTKKDFMNE